MRSKNGISKYLCVASDVSTSIISHDVISHLIQNKACHPIRSHPNSCHITSHHITSHPITSHHVTSHHITSHPITSHAILSCPITSYLMATRVSFCVGWNKLIVSCASPPPPDKRRRRKGEGRSMGGGGEENLGKEERGGKKEEVRGRGRTLLRTLGVREWEILQEVGIFWEDWKNMRVWVYRLMNEVVAVPERKLWSAPTLQYLHLHKPSVPDKRHRS